MSYRDESSDGDRDMSDYGDESERSYSPCESDGGSDGTTSGSVSGAYSPHSDAVVLDRGETDCAEVLKQFQKVSPLKGSRAVFFTEDPIIAVTRYCLEQRKKFADRDFPPVLRSLIGKGGHNNPRGKQYESNFVKLNETGQVAWKRPLDWVDDPEIFVNGVDVGDIQQGATGDCWFLSMMSSVAHTHPKTIEGIINPKAFNEVGAYSMGLFINGVRHWILLDDKLPIRRGQPLFVQAPIQRNELWPHLLEKCLAKWCGSYIDMSGSQILEHTSLTPEQVHKAFTGATAFSAWNAKEMPDDELKKHVTRLSHEGFVMTAGSRSNQQGLKPAHAYSLLNAQDVPGDALLRLRNPWGRGEWQGKWADDDRQWAAAGIDPASLHHDRVDDGVFFMNINDFKQHFEMCYAIGPGSTFYDPSRERTHQRFREKRAERKVLPPAKNIHYRTRGFRRPARASILLGSLCGLSPHDIATMSIVDLARKAHRVSGAEAWKALRTNFSQQEYFKSIGVKQSGAIKRGNSRNLRLDDGPIDDVLRKPTGSRSASASGSARPSALSASGGQASVARSASGRSASGAPRAPAPATQKGQPRGLARAGAASSSSSSSSSA